MNRSSFISLVREKLTDLHGIDETEAMGRILLEQLSRKYNRSFDINQEWTIDLSKAAEQWLHEIESGRPLQYVLNEAWFDNRNFWVDESVLIPRPETEELFDWIKRYYEFEQKPLSMLDIGTGSGILPISLKRAFPLSRIQAMDISSSALKVARKNAERWETDIDFIEMDFINPTQRSTLPKYDLIVSNPPYIALHEKSNLAGWVINHEPHLALFTPDENPLLFYVCIAEFGRSHLNPGGQIFVELHEDRAEETKEVFDQSGYKTELRKDMQGKWRMLRAEIN